VKASKKQGKNQGPQTSCLDYSSIGNFKISMQLMEKPEQGKQYAKQSEPCHILSPSRFILLDVRRFVLQSRMVAN